MSQNGKLSWFRYCVQCTMYFKNIGQKNIFLEDVVNALFIIN